MQKNKAHDEVGTCKELLELGGDGDGINVSKKTKTTENKAGRKENYQ